MPEDDGPSPLVHNISYPFIIIIIINIVIILLPRMRGSNDGSQGFRHPRHNLRCREHPKHNIFGESHTPYNGGYLNMDIVIPLGILYITG